MITFVLGPDALTARTNAARLAADIDPDGTTTVRLDGRAITVAAVIGEIASVGFFGATRIVVVDDLIARHHRPAVDDAHESDTQAATSDPGELARLLASVPPKHSLILVEPSLTTVPIAIKRLLPPETTVLMGFPPRGHDLLRWMIERARVVQGELNADAARRLADRLYPGTWFTASKNPKYDRPPDLDRLGQEIDKLALFAHPHPITEDHVNAITEFGMTDRLFTFLEAVERGDLARSVIHLDELTSSGMEHGRLAAQLFQQVELTLLLDVNSGINDPAAVGRSLKMANPARMVGIARGRRQRTPQEAHQRTNDFTDIERRTKRGMLRDAGDTLYQLVAASTHPGNAL
jgi:DNA polymerase III delta subunit